MFVFGYFLLLLFAWTDHSDAFVKVNCGLRLVLCNRELLYIFPLRKYFTSISLHAWFPEFDHVFSGMEMAVLDLLRHWHEYPWRSKEKLQHWNEAWDWKFLSHSFICWWWGVCVCVWHKGDLMNTASQRLYESRYSHTDKYLYTCSMSLLLNQRLEMNIIHWW